MLTYLLYPEDSRPLYEQLVTCLRNDILSGVLPPGNRLPSKRSFAENLGVSSITVENAYNRLIDEGYVVSEPKRGYYVEQLIHTEKPGSPVRETEIRLPVKQSEWRLDLSGNRTPPERFPFSVWTHLLRETVNEKGDALLTSSPCGGVRELREAIALHLRRYKSYP